MGSDAYSSDVLRNIKNKSIKTGVLEFTDTLKPTGVIDGPILSAVSEGYDIGDSGHRWKQVWFFRWVRSPHYHDGDQYCDNTYPKADNARELGKDSLRWSLIRGVTITSGDLGFEDKVCPVCGKPFRKGDSIVLKVRRVDDRQILTVPVHSRCNPHPLDPELERKHVEEVLNRNNNNLGKGEFEVIDVEVVGEDTMLLTVRFWDGLTTVVEVPTDADEDIITKHVLEARKSLEEEAKRSEEVRRKGMQRLKRDWKGFRGRVRR